MKIVIVGPGAMGCLLAGFLASSEDELWLLDYNKERAQTINVQGIKIEGISGNWQVRVKATAEVNEIKYADLIILCVKAYNTKEAITQAKALVQDNTHVLTLQNGIGNIEIIGEVTG
ncbi:MAG: NAD(P)-binding domain-containing protein, partial [Candidatus Omnitrophica bacterium]|nr:NAD(P)-binding domain-containing protein [Candidatus Omnitrophota bacterium]